MAPDPQGDSRGPIPPGLGCKTMPTRFFIPRSIDARRRLRATVGAAVACAVLALPTAATAAEKGLNTDLTWGITTVEQDQTTAAAQDLGAQWLRLNMVWSEVESREGTYKLGKYDEAIAKANATGAKVLVTVYQSPEWASGSNDPETPPQDPADYARFMGYVADRYRTSVDAWQIWNEQNFVRFWSTGPNAGQYAQLLKAAHGAIKAVDPNLKVIFGGLSLNDWAFVEQAYTAMPDLGNYYDAMASHPYTFPVAPPEAVRIEGDGRMSKGSFPSYREIRAVMLANGDDKPIWFTEWGWSTKTGTDGVTEAQQADYLARAYRCMEQDPYVEVALWYSFRNNYWANDADSWEDQLGLVRTDFSHKLAYDAFKTYTPGSGGCTYEYPGTTPPTEPEPVAPETTIPDPTPSEEEPTAEPDEFATSSVFGRMTLRIVRVRSTRRATVSGSEAPRVPLRIAGRLDGAKRGRMGLRLERRSNGDWRRHSSYDPRVSVSGRFETRRIKLRSARWRLSAVYRDRAGHVVRRRPMKFEL